MTLLTPDASRLVLLHGRDEPLARPRRLRAGALSALLDGLNLRSVRLGGHEVVRGISVSVRDRSWNTIHGTRTQVEVDDRGDSFVVHLVARHVSADVDFTWNGSIEGTDEGHIRFTMEGTAARDMHYNRIGFCMLHPWRETAHRSFRARGPAGEIEGTFPDLVAPQRIENGTFLPVGPAFSELEDDLETGTLVIELAGDVFEIEDQRNWSDASFKTYCTPLSVPRPLLLRRGEGVAQAVSAHAAGSAVAAAPARLAVGDAGTARVPPVGLGHGSRTLAAYEAELVHALRPAHLRHELHPARDWKAELGQALAECRRLGAALELALFLRVGDDERLAGLHSLLADVELARVFVAVEDAVSGTPDETTPLDFVALARRVVGRDDVPFAGGTDLDFCELNRRRPPVETLDGLFWSVNASVHADDDLSILETPEAQGEQVRAARAFGGDKPLFVGPVTLSPRRRGRGPDVRQATLLAAAWTLASAKHLAEQGAAAMTYFEPTGPGGVVCDRRAYPAYHVLADLCELRSAAVLDCNTTRPLEVAALTLRRDGELTLLAANLTPDPLAVDVVGLHGTARIRRLNESTAALAAVDIEGFRARRDPVALDRITLAPYETSRIDIHEEAVDR
jgi:hypothetical protein